MFSRLVDCDRSLSIFIQIGTNGLVSIGNNYTWPELPDSRQVICVYCAFIDNTDSVGGQCGRDVVLCLVTHWVSAMKCCLH